MCTLVMWLLGINCAKLVYELPGNSLGIPLYYECCLTITVIISYIAICTILFHCQESFMAFVTISTCLHFYGMFSDQLHNAHTLTQKLKNFCNVPMYVAIVRKYVTT